jgi:GTP pyrophosphokinase
VVDRIRLGRGVKIQGVDGLMVRYAQCCQPVPGDAVLGYVTKGRGVSIHRRDCPNLLAMSTDPVRRVEIDWREVQGEVFVVCLAVRGDDRRGLYADLMEAVSDTGTNIKSAELTSQDGAMTGVVLVEVENHAHLAKVMRGMRRVKGVHGVERRDPARQGGG